MLIKALCEYSDMLSRKGENNIPPYASEQKVHYMIYLTADGEISGIADIRNRREIELKNDKKKPVFEPRTEIFPKRSQKPGIDINIVEHRPLYIFGLNYEKGVFTTEDKTNKARKSHECFVNGNLEFCKDLTSELAKAYCAFIEKWNPAEQTENPHLLELGKEYSTSYFCFALDGHPEAPLNRDSELVAKYAEQFAADTAPQDNDEETAVCAIEGERLPIARIHDKIKGIRGGNPVGGALVCINETAFESYGKSQSFNSNISEKAMKKYTSALNKLIADRGHHTFIEDTTLVFFAMSEEDENECDFFKVMMEGTADEKMNKNLLSIAQEMRQGRVGSLAALDIDENVTFYVAGLTPNSSRISQKFILRNRFGKIIENVMKHQNDIAMKEDGKQVYFYQIMKELVSPKSKEESVPSPLSSAVMYSVLNGTKYPEGLLSTVIRRIKTDSDEENNRFIKMNNVRIGIIKACLNRKMKNKEEEMKMALDIENKDPAYLCGRLFATLEYIQQRALGDLNKTIKDSFFSTACSKPATVFPRLIMLSQHHMAKLESEGYWNGFIGKIANGFGNEFPQTLSLDEQGRFIIGYYHQNADFYTKKTENK